MSYGMMMCVQMDRKDIFDKLWTFSERYMLLKDGPCAGYFRWSVHIDGSSNSNGPAPDGEEYFAMALFMAAARWGDGEGSFNYTARAREILRHAVHQHEMVKGGEPMWEPWTRIGKKGYDPIFNESIEPGTQYVYADYNGALFGCLIEAISKQAATVRE